MTKLQKVLGAVKSRKDTKQVPFELSIDRLQVAEEALGSPPDNTLLRTELTELFDRYKGMQSIWEQAPSPASIQTESANVLKRLEKGADPLRVLNAHPYKKENHPDGVVPNRKTTEALRKIKLNSGISGELLGKLIHHGVDTDAPDRNKVIDALTILKNEPRQKTGHPEKFPRNGMLLELVKIYKRETGKEATYSSNTGRSGGAFMDLCRAMLIPAKDYMSMDALGIEKALQRLKKLTC